MVKQLRRIEGVHFSLSGHTLGLSDKKLAPMLQEVSTVSASLPQRRCMRGSPYEAIMRMEQGRPHHFIC
jgi:hypothetical protein